MTARDWTFIDATIDNTVAIAAQDGDEPTIEQGRSVREAGWAVARRHPQTRRGWGGWPPHDEDFSVQLPVQAWRFIAGELLRWHDVEVLTNPHAEGIPELRGPAIAKLVGERIGELR